MFPRILCTLAAAALGVSQLAYGQRLIQLPAADIITSPQAAVLTLSPLVQEKLVSVGIDVANVFQRNDPNPANITYWVLSRAGSDALRIFDANFILKKSINFGLTAGSAAMSPDGRIFVMTVLNNVRAFDTTTETEIQFNAIDIGPSGIDAVITHDSKRLYVFSASAQRITAIDLVNRTVVGTLSTPLASSGSLALGANGMLYAAYENNLIEIDPTVPLNDNAVRRRTIVGGKAGKVLITPDGRRALVTNSQSSTGQATQPALLSYINLADGINSPLVTPAELIGGPVFDQIVLAGNNIAFAIANTAPVRKLYKITLPPVSETTGILDVPTAVEAFFSSKGTLETANFLSASGEYPVSQQLFVSSRLSQLLSTQPDVIFNIDVPRNAYVGQTPVTFPVGPSVVVRPPRTANNVAPAAIVSLGTYQPQVPQGGRSRPIGVRVLDGNGLPVSGSVVTFLSSLPGVLFEGADSIGNLITNPEGYAFVVAIAPAANGIAQITASTPGVSTTSAINITVGTPPTGGGGGGGTGTAGISLVSGNGQAQQEGISLRFPLVVRVADAQGNPLAGVPVTWTATGAGRPLEGAASAAQVATERITLTNDQGFASQTLFPTLQTGSQIGYSSITMVASTVAAGSVTFNATSYQQVSPDGSLVPKPSALLLVPENSREIIGRAGELLPDAIQVRFTASGISLGQPIANLGIEIVPVDGASANSPTAKCAPESIALSNQQGLASCSLRLAGITGSGTLRAVLGGALGEVTFSLTVLPGIPAKLNKVSGDNQSGLPGATLANQLVARVTDAQDTPLAGQIVRWQVTQGSATVLSTQSTTSAGGLATVGVILGSNPGTVQIQATINNTSVTTTFVATVNAIITQMNKVRGDNQIAIVGTSFESPLTVELRDSQSRAVAGTGVTFAVVSGPVSLNGNATVTSNTDGQASVNVLAGSSPGTATIRATSGSFTQEFTLTVRPVEVFNATDIRNVATNAGGVLSPGGLYRILARGVAPGLNGVQTANLLFGPLPLRIRNVTVQIGTVFVPIFQVENINGVEAVVVQAPFELTPGSTDSVTIRVENTGISGTVNGIPVVAVQPGIFETVDTNNQRYLVAQHLDGRYVTINDPARLGEQIRAYFTGGGKQFASQPNTGVATAGAAYTGGIAVGVNGSGARVVSARYTPGMVGVYDVVFEVPSVIGPGDNPNTLATGDARPFVIQLTPVGGGAVAVGSVVPIGR